jgi:tetratricopeptide (TPR) repeat protein
MGIRSGWLYALIVLALLLTYGQIVQHGFVAWDDEGHITGNPHLKPVSWQSLVRFWREPYFLHYVPVSYTFFAAQAWLAPSRGGLGQLEFHPGVFHAGSLMMHLACVLFVFRLLRMIVDDTLAACVGSLLFALHPLAVESVAWISEQRGMLAGIFSLLAIIAWLRFGAGVPDIQKDTPAWREPALRGAGGGWAYYVAATTAFALALLSKPSAASLPLIAAGLDCFLLGRSWRVSLVALLPWLTMAAGLLAITKTEQSDTLLTFVTPLWARPLIAGDALQFYLTKLVWPVNLMVQYPRAPQLALAGNRLYIAWLVPVAIVLICFRYRREGPWLACAAWFVAALLPVLGLIPFVYQVYSTVADRYAYLALVAPAWALAWWLSRDAGGWRLGLAAVGLLVLGALSFQQTGHWRDNETLFTHTLRLNPHSDVAYGNWGSELLRRGRYEEALQHFDEFFRLNPQAGPDIAYLNRGFALFGLGRIDEAIAVYEQALALYPDYALAHVNLSFAYFQKQNWERTIHHAQAALAEMPESGEARFNLAQALDRQGREEEAAGELRKLLQYSPTHFEAHMKLATLLVRRGEMEQALPHFAAALRQQPDNEAARQEYVEALEKASNP